MKKLLYRYRPLEVVKESFYEEAGIIKKQKAKTVVDELRNQEIFLGTVSENNDPMDGRIPFIWEGDRIIWKNFFKNYCKYLLIAYYNTVIFGDNTEINKEIIFINSESVINIEKLPINTEFEIFYKKAKQDETLSKVISFIIDSKSIEEELLVTLFDLVHPLILKHMKEVLKRNKNQEEFLKYLTEEDLKESTYELIEGLMESKQKEEINKVYNNIEEKELLLKYELSKHKLQNQYKYNIKVINYIFPSIYIKKLKKSLYNEYYLACFSEKNNSQLMWSHYGDSHKGISLIYELEEDPNGVKIKLENGEKYIKPIKYKINESKINIFENIGNLPYSILEKKWLLYEGESSSSCKYYASKDFHSKYWDKISEKTFSKFKEWEYEGEYRMVDYPMSNQKKEMKDRLLKYDLTQLKGIIFGLKTPDDEKFKILNEIDKTLSREQRKEFKFYQVKEKSLGEELEIHKFDFFGIYNNGLSY